MHESVKAVKAEPRNLISIGLIRFSMHEIRVSSVSNEFPIGVTGSHCVFTIGSTSPNTSMKKKNSSKATTEIHVFMGFHSASIFAGWPPIKENRQLFTLGCLWRKKENGAILLLEIV